MATYSYRLRSSAEKDTIEGVIFYAGINNDYTSDQYSLNKWVPTKLERWIDGVPSNEDLTTEEERRRVLEFAAQGDLVTKTSLPNELVAMGGAISVKAHGAKSDGIALYDVTVATVSGLSSVFTSASASASGKFNASDIGKILTVIPYTDSGQTPRRGVITAVDPGVSITATMNVSPGTLSNATIVYGTDDGAAIDAALLAASGVNGVVSLPVGITCTKRLHVVPTGVCLEGVVNNSTGGAAKDFRHCGSSLVSMTYAASAFITLGNTAGSPRGCTLRNINIDCLGWNTHCVTGGTRTVHMHGCTIVRGISTVCIGSATWKAHDNVFMGQNAQDVVSISGDSTFVHNLVIGAGNGYAAIKLYNADDVLVAHNHVWKSNVDTMLGPSIYVYKSASDVAGGNIVILGNKFDSPFGQQIQIKLAGATTLRGLSIIGNLGFSNDLLPNATYPWISLDVATGCSIRGLVIQGNIGRGSWNDPTKGQWTYFIDGSAILGNIYGSIVGGNFIDNCGAMYKSFVPDHDGGNITIAGTGTTMVKSTTT